MSSRFVAAGSDQSPTTSTTQSSDGWAKARHEVESRKSAKAVESGKQDDGKSLYDVLQANKAAKQEAFEEASKLRNQFRPLDDSEVEFLDSVRESERAKEISIRQETSEQLETFRKQQSEIERAAIEAENDPKDTEQATSNTWKTSKKRRREKDDGDDPISKSRKSSTNELDQDVPKSVANSGAQSTDRSHSEDKHASIAPTQPVGSANSATIPAGLGLSAYDSDDD